ncbi:DUF4249 domain-containing protein [Lewinella sp. IMCC34183]|uniref:DUF4249 domain-containing protein n=1 Tax=Lewinella sp. IMCC34183 TaxID=2248762 RepID=UPI000E286837|nr:DUF4249 domain-containing protein [Lewinella sp. IMCC34183]
MIKLLPFAFLLFLLQSCVEPVVPEYDYTTGFLLVEGDIVDQPGYSRVALRRSTREFGNYRLDPVTGAAVSSIDGDGREVPWRETEAGTYVPPEDFVAQAGQTYHLEASLLSGEHVISEDERLPTAVDLPALRMRFEQEAYYSSEAERFVPAFTLLADVADPAGEDNFYRYTHRSWSQLAICATCYNSVYRNGSCVQTPASRNVPRYDYSCDGTCWAITRGRSVRLLSDALNPDGIFRDVPVARLDYVGSGGLLVEVEQYAITRAAFAYYEVLQDLTEGSSGLNAPLPAPLYGNLRATDDAAPAVLGYVAVSSLATRRLYWNRDAVDGEPLSRPPPPVFEPVSPSPPSAPCAGPNRTATEPEGWQQ